MQRWDPHGPLQSCAWFLHPSCFVFLYGFYRLLFIMFHTFVSFYYYFYDSRFVSTALIRFSFKVLPKILMKLSSCLSNLLFFTVSGHTSHLLCCCLFFSQTCLFSPCSAILCTLSFISDWMRSILEWNVGSLRTSISWWLCSRILFPVLPCSRLKASDLLRSRPRSWGGTSCLPPF